MGIVLVQVLVSICSISEYVASLPRYGAMLSSIHTSKLPKDNLMATGGKRIMEMRLYEMMLQSTKWTSNSKSAMGQIIPSI